MYSRKSVGPRIEPWGTLALTGYFCEYFPSRSTRSSLILRKDNIMAKYLTWNSERLKFVKKISMPNLASVCLWFLNIGMISTQSHTEDREFYELNAYGFSLSALKLIHNYLPYRKQRIQIWNFHSRWFELIFGEPQWSILNHVYSIFSLSTYFLF